MTTVLIPSKMSTEEANKRIYIERRINAGAISRNAKDIKYFNIMMALFVIEIHTFIFNFMKSIITNNGASLLYIIGVLVVFIVILANYRVKDNMSYNLPSVFILGTFVFLMTALVILDVLSAIIGSYI